MKYHFTPSRIVYLKKMITSVVRMWRPWNPHTLLVGVYNGTAALEDCLAVKLLNMGATISPSSFTPSNMPKRSENMHLP